MGTEDLVLQVSTMDKKVTVPKRIFYISEEAKQKLKLDIGQTFKVVKQGRDIINLVETKETEGEDLLRVSTMGKREIIYIKAKPLELMELDRGSLFTAKKTKKGIKLIRMRPSIEDYTLKETKKAITEEDPKVIKNILLELENKILKQT